VHVLFGGGVVFFWKIAVDHRNIVKDIGKIFYHDLDRFCNKIAVRSEPQSLDHRYSYLLVSCISMLHTIPKFLPTSISFAQNC